MKEITRLLILFLKESWGLSQLQWRRHNDRKAFAKQMGVILFVALIGLMALGVYTVVTSMLAFFLEPMGFGKLYLPVLFIGISLFVVFFGIPHILSEFYYSDTISMILPLPVKAEVIILSKFASVMVVEWLVATLMFLPPVIFYSIAAGRGVLYYLGGIIATLVLPIIPLSIIMVLLMLVMHTGALKGRKDVLRGIMLFIIFGVSMLPTILINRMNLSGEGEFTVTAETITTFGTKIYENVTMGYPPARFVGWICSDSPFQVLGGSVLLVALSAALMFLLVFVGKRVYIAGILAEREGVSGKKRAWSKTAGDLKKSRLAWIALMLLDLKQLFKTPIYLFNNVSIVVLLPLIFLLIFSAPRGETGGIEALGALSEGLLPQLHTFFIFGLTTAFTIFSFMTSITATSFSREGKNGWLTRMVPLSAKDQLLGRSGSAVCIQLIGIVVIAIPTILLLPITPLDILAALLLTVVATVPQLVFGLLIDLFRPLLDWTDPQRAVKNNLNAVIQVFGGFFYLFLVTGIAVAFSIGIHPAVGYGFFILINGFAGGLSIYFFQKYYEERCFKMEE